MTSNTKNNINLNKLNEDNLNTQMATGQKITRPSDDPVIAIRALRLNTNISQLNQYYEKNIPDADAWLKITETALSQTDGVFTSIKENLTTGASDTNTATDRQKILDSLKGMRDEIYSAGNADYAGRTVFTGYRTGESLTFLSTDKDLNSSYSMRQLLGEKSVDTVTYISCADKTDNGGDYKETNVTSTEIYRIRLPYDNLTNSAPSLNVGGAAITPTVFSTAGKTQDEIDEAYLSMSSETGSAAVYIPETGEIIISKAVKDQLETATNATVDFSKNSWKSGDLRPEHYFACVKTENGTSVNYNFDESGNPNFVDQEMQVEISFNQKITINTNADKVYTHDIGRDIDDLINATQEVVDLDNELTKLKSELSKAADADKPAVQSKLDATNKEYSLKKDKMQKMFANALDKFDGYADRNNEAIASIGSLSLRLKITKERVGDQLESFKELADDNINISLTDAAIDLKNADLALQAAQMAASKIAQQTLLNYL